MLQSMCTDQVRLIQNFIKMAGCQFSSSFVKCWVIFLLQRSSLLKNVEGFKEYFFQLFYFLPHLYEKYSGNLKKKKKKKTKKKKKNPTRATSPCILY